MTIAFPKLEHLYFATMGGWEKWEVEEEREKEDSNATSSFLDTLFMPKAGHILFRKKYLIKNKILFLFFIIYQDKD